MRNEKWRVSQKIETKTMFMGKCHEDTRQLPGVFWNRISSYNYSNDRRKDVIWDCPRRGSGKCIYEHEKIVGR